MAGHLQASHKTCILKSLFVFLAMLFLMQACNDGAGVNKDAPVTQPSDNATSDSTNITSDSITSADDVPNNGLQAGDSDSTERN
jgi:uncharacterized lipoprotein YajG